MPRRLTSIGLTVYLTFLTLIVLVFGWFILPRFSAVFADFQTDLPLLTVVVIAATGFLTRGPGIVLLLAFPIVVPMLISRYIFAGATTGQKGRRVFAVYAIITVLIAVLVLCVALSVFLPLVNVMQSVSSPKTGGR